MDKTVLVTGASGGIGSAIAKTFALNGDKVLLGCHSHLEEAQTLSHHLNQKGCQTACFQADITQNSQVQQMFQALEHQFGPVDILINNAGIASQKLFSDITEQEWDAMFNVHVKGTFLCCQQALIPMVRRKQGCIINISSMWGQVGASCEVHYSSAKAAVIGLTQALAKEVAPSGIRVNCVAPGAVSTAMMQGFSQQELTDLCTDIPMGRMGKAEEIAQVVLFLAGEGASYLTGQVLSPNGGMIC